MNLGCNAIDALRSEVRKYMSEKRYEHTLCVERMAEYIGEHCLPDKVAALKCAALLHDIAKELDADQLLKILGETPGINDHDILSSPAHHAFCAPKMIKKHFPEFATDDILSACFNHTTGSPDMSLFDEIIFISDYTEESRTYFSCIECRTEIIKALESATDRLDKINAVHRATVYSLENTASSLKVKNKFINPRTLDTLIAFSNRLTN